MAPAWKVGWVQALGGSNPPFSARYHPSVFQCSGLLGVDPRYSCVHIFVLNPFRMGNFESLKILDGFTLKRRCDMGVDIHRCAKGAVPESFLDNFRICA